MGSAVKEVRRHPLRAEQSIIVELLRIPLSLSISTVGANLSFRGAWFCWWPWYWPLHQSSRICGRWWRIQEALLGPWSPCFLMSQPQATCLHYRHWTTPWTARHGSCCLGWPTRTRLRPWLPILGRTWHTASRATSTRYYRLLVVAPLHNQYPSGSCSR